MAALADSRPRAEVHVRPSIRQRLLAGALIGLVELLQRLPDRIVYRVGHAIGVGLSFLLRERRARASRNLERVCRWLDARGAASSRVHAAAHDPRALDAMVRDLFGHWLVAYLEGAMAPRYDAAALRGRLRIETPEVVDEALGPHRPGEPGRVFVSLHLGSLDIAGLYAARVNRLPVVGPMETVRNPALAAYFQRTRCALGVRLVPFGVARQELLAALARGEGVGIVADRVISGQGARSRLFGATTRLPIGPAVLALETGAPMYLLAVRRTGPGEWAGRIEVLRAPTGGNRRERIQTVLEAQARAFERFVADAPEQWWTLLFPIWEEDAA
jgi:KDO2-lipid IV(A) lauroyltransferase